MRISNLIGRVSVVALLAALVGLGCDKGGGGGGGDLGDVGDNNPDVYVALGDSTVDGNNGGGAPFPPRLAAITGKTVHNFATQNGSSADGAARVGGIMAQHKPAAVCFMFGAVDLINNRGIDATIANLRSIIRQVKANKSVPVVATLQPMIGSHSRWSGQVKELNSRIRSMASEEGARVADVESAFGSGEGLILGDGLHPNEEGNQIMAEAFADKL